MCVDKYKHTYRKMLCKHADFTSFETATVIRYIIKYINLLYFNKMFSFYLKPSPFRF